ncbi:uncharacterized protein LOC107263348 isoform X2 [Cephus cinctus]|uniref:Uncharacterized protein LOC107263348 isoform X2 n=1 Tax=Cephus cinctus TaxID=211228 RepID=A0AAJ7BHW5_CEPCN|nr:uncharacterized protein LOC107263348 isoform X2 [Cephus cinctus]
MSHFDWKLLRRKKVIPAERRGPEKDETWTLASEGPDPVCCDPEEVRDARHKVLEVHCALNPHQETAEYEPNLPRSHETRKSKTKRVKSYLRKCKDALSRSEEGSVERRKENSTSWYLDENSRAECQRVEPPSQDDLARPEVAAVPTTKEDEEHVGQTGPVTEVQKEYERGSKMSLYEDATDLVQDHQHAVDGEINKESLETLLAEDSNLNKCDSSDTLIAEVVPEVVTAINELEVELTSGDHKDNLSQDTSFVPVAVGIRADVASLVRNLLGPLYGEAVLDLLTRQARDILVCAYHGNLENFLKSYLSPAADLLGELKRIAMENGNESVVPEGWPLTLARSGVILQLGELEASALRIGECYLCVRQAAATATEVNGESARSSVEIALVWRASMRAPGILGWDREDEYMDWRDTQKAPPAPSSSSSAKSRPRRRSREELQARPRGSSSDTDSRSAERFEAAERIECSGEDREDLGFGVPVAKSKSSSSVDSWKEEPTEWRRRPKNSSLSREAAGDWDSGRKIKRTGNVSSMTMEKWKETTRCDLKSRALNLTDLKTPFDLEKAATSDVPQSSDINHHLGERLHPDQVTDDDLPALIETLLVSIERMIERVSIDDIAFPCPACRNMDTDDPLLGCSCSDSCDCTESSCQCESRRKEPGGRSFEVAGIKHIDSDDEEEVRMGFGTKKRLDEITAPRTIDELPDHVLNCGLTLPGYRDSAGRLVIEYDSRIRETLNARDMATFILYLSRLPSFEPKDEFTLLINGDPQDDLELLDKALLLVQERIRVQQALLLRNGPTDISGSAVFPRSQIKDVVVVDGSTICKYISRRDGVHSQTHWIAFYKEYDNLMTEWQTTGRRLLLEMSELKDSSSISRTLTPLSRLLADPTLRRTSRDAEDAIASLEERAGPFSHVEHVRLSLDRARRLIEEVGNAAKRLESSFESRRSTLRNLSVLRSIEDQAHEVLSWLCKKGEDILSKQAQHTATTLTAARLHEREFEKFYFTSMRHLDKGSDLAEAASTSGLRELARSLKQHLRGFGSRLEDRREYLEDTSRCCLLQDRAFEWAQEARVAGERRAQQFLMARPPLPPEHFTEMMSLAEKLGNEILIEQCRIARNKCLEALEFTRTTSAPGSPARRRSYAASESACSWDDALMKRTSWDESDSASYACPMDGIGSGSGGKPVLDNIAELRESAEQLLDCSPPRTPPRSPPPRRLAKPPVNSHLHRAPSIAPGMKAKKTILLIMREMIQTERDYVKSLEYIIENYIPELVREDIPQALRGQRNVIFGNVEKIYEFHSQHFLRELEQCEQCPMMIGQCFLRHEKKFYLYALYNKNKPNSDSLMAEYGTIFFKTKQLELGDKMDLASYLLKPVQRMGKYALLLQQLLKAGTDLSEQFVSKEDDKEDKEESNKPVVEGEADLRAAEQMVRFQLRHGNDLLAMDSLRDCDVNVKEQGRLLRQNEFLVWQGKGKKCLRQVFLFEDLILFSKARRFPDRKNLDIYIYKHSIKTTDIGLTAVIADSPTKFEIWFRKRKPGDTYTLQCASEDIKKAWAEELSNLLWKQALRNREVRLAEMSSMGIGNKPCLDIRPSADQINDRSISVAQLSKTPRFRNSIAVSISEDSGRCSRRPHSVISVSSSSSSGGSSGPPTTLHLGLDTSPRPHHRSTTLNSQCSVESGIIADISIVSDDGGDGADRSHWNSTLESPTSNLPTTSTPIQSPTSATAAPVTSPSSSDANLTPYDQDMSINL